MRYVNGTRAEDLAGTGLVTKQRLMIPFGLLATWWLLCLAARQARAAAGRMIRHPWLTTLALAGAWAVLRFGRWGALTFLALVGLALVAWLWRSPATFRFRVIEPAHGAWRWVTFYRWRWYDVMRGTKLLHQTPDRVVILPKITAITSTGTVDTLHVRLLHGHTPEDFFDRAEGLRHAFKAYRLAVIQDAPGRIRLRVYARDPLADVVQAVPVEQVPAVPELGGLMLGLSEEGRPYRLRLLSNHVLVAGATGAGKGSVLWSTLNALGPGIASGHVAVTGLDPKGGMELHPGRPLFAHYADRDGEQMAACLEAAVERMSARKTRMRDAGQRAFTPGEGEPFEVVLIDELAWLSSYNPDRRIKDRVKAALSLLLSQGRAVGFCVIACLQDPRKDVLSFRDLFPTRVALRLAEDSHIDMVLGDGAKARGALCHLIPDTLPGIGYVHVEGAHEPVRVRFSWITDHQIGAMGDRWPAPENVGSNARVIDLAGRDRADHPAVPDQWPGLRSIESEPPGA